MQLEWSMALLLACLAGIQVACGMPMPAASKSEVQKVLDTIFQDGELSAHGTEGGLYGETGVDAIGDSIAALKPNSNQVFVDLGSGNGKINLIASMLFNFKKSVGFENSNTRHEQACRMLDVLKNSSNAGAMPASFHGSLEFYKGDFTVENWADADILFGGLLPDDQLMKKLADKFRLMKNGAKVLMLKDINPDYLKDIAATGSTNHKLGWTSAHPIYSYERKDGQKTDREIKDEEDKKKKEAQEKDSKDAPKSSSLLASISSSTPSSFATPSVTAESILQSIQKSMPSVAPPAPTTASTFDSIIASMTKPSVAPVVATPATPSITSSAFDLKLPPIAPSAPISTGASYDALLASLSRPIQAAPVVAPVTTAQADYEAVLAKLNKKEEAPSSQATLDSILASFSKTPATTNAIATGGDSIAPAWRDTFKAVLEKTLGHPAAAPPPPAVTANTGSVLGSIGGYNKPSSVLGVNIPGQAEAASFLQLEDDLVHLLADGPSDEKANGNQIQALFGEHKDDELRAQDPPDMAFKRSEIKLDNGKSVFVFEKVGEQDDRAVAISRLATATTNLIGPMPGIEMRHGATCTHQF